MSQRALKLILYGHDTCSLCDRLEAMLQPHLDRYNATLTKQNIKDYPELVRRYGRRIPVLTLDDRVLIEGKPQQDKVIEALYCIRGHSTFTSEAKK